MALVNAVKELKAENELLKKNAEMYEIRLKEVEELLFELKKNNSVIKIRNVPARNEIRKLICRYRTS